MVVKIAETCSLTSVDRNLQSRRFADATCIASANLHVDRDRTFLAFSGLELYGVALVEVFELGARRETAAVKKNIFAAVVGDDETEPFLFNNLLDRTGHSLESPFNLLSPMYRFLTIPSTLPSLDA